MPTATAVCSPYVTPDVRLVCLYFVLSCELQVIKQAKT